MLNSVSYTEPLILVPWSCKLEKLTTFYDHTNHLSCSRFRIKQHWIFFKRWNLWHVQKVKLALFLCSCAQKSTIFPQKPSWALSVKSQIKAVSHWPPEGTLGGTGALLHWGWCSPSREPTRDRKHTNSISTGTPPQLWDRQARTCYCYRTSQVTQLLLCLQEWTGLKRGSIRNYCCSPWQKQCGYDVFKKSPYVMHSEMTCCLKLAQKKEYMKQDWQKMVTVEG